MISQDAKNQLQEKFSRLMTINNLLEEAKIAYFDWIKDVENYDIQITEQELQGMVQYRNTIKNQIQQIKSILEN